ncbi:MAG: DPP IV N-terminal domain-containing protein [Acidobacteria bacterium]|nr:DPP IV N-terminal domain-containing protein [Acidobacteriota bacterium]
MQAHFGRVHRKFKQLVVTALCFGLALAPVGAFAQDKKADADARVQKANYDLASRWTAQKVGKMVFDTAVTPHWFESGDKFWYSYETGQGRKFYLVDPLKKSKAPLFDNAKMAAQLTTITRIPYDAQHLPITSVRMVKKDSAFQFDISVPREADIPGLKKEEQAVAGSGQEQGTPEDEPEGENVAEDDDDDPQQRGGQAAGQRPPVSPNRTVYFEWELANSKLSLLPDYQPPRKTRWAAVSPDEKTIVFARGSNLFMMDADNYAKALKKEDDTTIVETQITTDGEENYSYARRLREEEKAAYKFSEKNKTPRVPAVTVYWSKDSKKFSTLRSDQRKVADLWVINSLSNPRPTLETYRYGMPGEVNQPQADLEVFDIASKARVKIKEDRFPDQQVAVYTAVPTNAERERARFIQVDRSVEQDQQQQQQGGGQFGSGVEPKWLADGSDKLYFNRTSRDLKKIDVCVADTATGEVKTLIEERLNTYVEVKPLVLIGNGQELIHWSERDGWGHYYLFGADGTLKNQITSGEFYCDSIEAVDEKTRTLYVNINGHETGEDPYYLHTYSVNFSGAGMKLLNPGDGSHAAATSDSGKYFVDNASRVNSVPESVLCDQLGNKLMDLEKTDLSAMNEAGYKFPEPFKVKADDGVTDLYGVMYKPFDFDEKKKYPIIAYVYPGPQTESVTKTFTPRNDRVTLAQFGFIVIEVGNRGGHPSRSKWYHNYGYGNLRDYGLADKKAAIEQLSRRHAFIDIDRVGIYGHSGGGFMSTAAMLVYPDFFKVAVSSSGNHENNIYNRWWSEKHNGVKEVTDKDGNVKYEYTIEKNSDLAKNLKGHLLLVTGDIDDNVHPANTLRMADALIKANKRFDFFIIPGKRHGYADATNYFFWLRADYFCKHLLGDVATDVDMVELNKEREQTGDKGAAARRGGIR